MNERFFTLLRIHDVCKGLSSEEINKVAAAAEVVEFEEGKVILEPGEKLDSLYLVARGRIKLIQKSPGMPEQTIRYVSSGDQFGALMLITDDEFPLRVVVDEQAVLLKFGKQLVQDLVEELPGLRRNLLRKIGFSVRDSLLKKRKRSNLKVVAFIHANDQTRGIVTQVARRLADIGEKIGVLGNSPESPYGSDISFQSIRAANGDYLNLAEMQSLIDQMPELDRVFIVVDRPHPFENLLRLVEISEIVFCLSTTHDPMDSISALKRILEMHPSYSRKSHFVWATKPGEQVSPLLPELKDLVERDFKVEIDRDNTKPRLHRMGIEQLVHYLRGVKIGIALSGGAARGMTHLGVLKALEESGIYIDAMAGTSAGVLTGLTYCAGIEPGYAAECFTTELEPGSIYKRIPMGDGFYMIKQFRTKTWDRMLRKYVFDWQIEQFPIPLYAVTTDLIGAKSVIQSTGDGVRALLESINLPVISAPISRDGMMLVDGGILNNLPSDVLVKNGCNFVIAVDVSANIEHQIGINTPETPTEKMKTPGIFSTLMRCLNVQAHGLSGHGAEAADIIIAPDVSQFDLAKFSRTPEMTEIGYQTALKSIPQIRQILNGLDPLLFSKE